MLFSGWRCFRWLESLSALEWECGLRRGLRTGNISKQRVSILSAVGLPTRTVGPDLWNREPGASGAYVPLEEVNASEKENWTVIREETHSSFLASLHFVQLRLGAKVSKIWMWLQLNSLPGSQWTQSKVTTQQTGLGGIMSAPKAKQSRASLGQSRKIHQSRRKEKTKPNKQNSKRPEQFWRKPLLYPAYQNSWSWLTLRSGLPQERNRGQ